MKLKKELPEELLFLEEEPSFDDKITTVCFTGHRNVPENEVEAISALLEAQIYDLYDRGARIFKTGGAVGFDTMAAKAVLSMKDRFGEDGIHLYLCLAAPNQAMRFSKSQKADFDYIFSMSDGVTYASESLTKDSYFARNRALVRGSDVCLAYCKKQYGGSYYTCRQALSSGVELVNLADFLCMFEN